jgi:hypothetical protein
VFYSQRYASVVLGPSVPAAAYVVRYLNAASRRASVDASDLPSRGAGRGVALQACRRAG